MKIGNSIIVLIFLTGTIFYTSCSPKPETPDACLKVTDTLGNEITTAKLNEPIYFLNCGDRFVLNAVFSGVAQPWPVGRVNPVTGTTSSGKPSAYGQPGSVGVNIPANSTDREGTILFNNACKKYVYGDLTSVTGVFNIVLVATNVSTAGKDIVRSTKSVSLTITPDN